MIKPIEKVLAELEAARGVEGLITVGECPVRAIREIKEDGQDVYLGDIGISRCLEGRLLALPDREASEERMQEYIDCNSQRKVGDADIIWTIGGKCSVCCCCKTLRMARLSGTELPWSRHHDRRARNVGVGLGGAEDGCASHSG